MGSYAVPDELGNDLLAAHSVQTATRPVHAASFSWKVFGRRRITAVGLM